MKKLGMILAIIAIVALAGCGSSGGSSGGGGGGGGAPFIVDLSTLTAAEVAAGDKVGATIPGGTLKNQKPFTKPWENFIVLFPENWVDVSKYQRITITLKYYNASGAEIEPADSMAQVNFVTDINGDWRGPAMDPGPNTPLKQQNIGGYSGMVNKDRGVRHGCAVPPSAMIVQAAQTTPAFIEVTGIIWHNGDYKTE